MKEELKRNDFKKSQKKILIVGSDNRFEKNVKDCLNSNYNTYISLANKIRDGTEIVIFNLLTRKKRIGDLKKILKLQYIKKIILLENAKDLYQNNVSLPFSVYKQFLPKSRISKSLKKYEELIQNSGKNFTIFRVSEVYGPNIESGIIHKLLNENQLVLHDGERDFLYEGDLIQAIEIAIDSNAIGIFDIAYGETIKMKDAIDFINRFRGIEVQVKWKRKQEDIVYNCENFKFYKWLPLVNFHLGLNAIKNNKNF